MLECHGYQETFDFLGYMIVYYPNIPPDDELTAEEAFGIAIRGIESVEAQAKSFLRAADCEQARLQIEEAARLHRVGDSDAVHVLLQQAWNTLRKKRK